MERKEIEVKDVKYVYVAADGTEFSDKDQCEVYEKSAYCVIRSRFMKLVVFESSEYGAYECGSDENEAYVVIPKSKEDIDAIKMFLVANDAGKGTVNSFTDEFIGKVFVINVGYDHDWAGYTNLGNLVDRLTDGKYEIVEKKGE